MVNFQQIAADILRHWVNTSATLSVAEGPRSAHSAFAAASTSSACPVTETLGHTLAIRWSGPIRKVTRGDAHELAPVHRLLLPHTIGLEHAVFLVRGERDRKLVLGLELVLRRHRIGGDAEDSSSGFAEGAFEAGKVDRFLGASGVSARG
jgi:hypothetical protein